MSKSKTSLLLIVILFILTGCKASFIKVNLLTEGRINNLEIKVVQEDNDAKKKELKEMGYLQISDDFKRKILEENVYLVLPEHVVNKFRLKFQEGVFLVTSSDRTIGLAKPFIAENSPDGKRLELTNLKDENQIINIPLDKVDDPENVVGIVILSYVKPWWEWVDVVNIIHDDSDYSKAMYLPFHSAKKIKNTEYQYLLSPGETQQSDLGNAVIMLGVVNLNSDKTREQVYSRAKDPGIAGNYGSNFIVPFGGAILEVAGGGGSSFTGNNKAFNDKVNADYQKNLQSLRGNGWIR